MNTWHTIEAASIVAQLQSDVHQGLSESEAAQRLAKDGPNAIPGHGTKSAWNILAQQLASVMALLLLSAAVISLFLGDYIDAGAIFAIFALNTILGFIQEYKAEKAMEALKKLAAPHVRVRRSGRVFDIAARELVRGDIVILEAGAAVPADGRLIHTANLRAQESGLTGESEAVEKSASVLQNQDIPLGDRSNMVYLGTTVVSGRGLAVVTETAMNTELGKIAKAVGTIPWEATPLQRRLEHLSRVLAGAAIFVVTLFFALGLWRGEPLRLIFMTAVSMAVAAVPEGLPAVVTVVLTIGAQRMLKRKALIRKLTAVETLGSVTVICSDKTGTLTENRMSVAMLDVAGNRLDLSEALHGEGLVLSSENIAAIRGTDDPEILLLLATGALCNDAFLEPKPDRLGRFHAVGDPTESALVAAAASFGMSKPVLEQAFQRISEVPFDSSRKRMTTLHRVLPHTLKGGGVPTLLQEILDQEKRSHVIFTKGSVEGLLDICTEVWVQGAQEPMTELWRKRILDAADSLSKSGMRVLGTAFKMTETPELGLNLERNLIFIGMTGMIDPPRPEVRQAVQTCREAGIRPLMITGDHPLTALSIAESLGIGDGDRALTGLDVEAMSDEELQAAVGKISIFARVSPEHKLRIVSALNRRGHIVAMTGDGVNDAPALKKAAIGVSMGITGTDVAKEASAMVLLDDNFATIVAAVKEGRVVYDNIRKFIKYLMATNTGELWIMLLAALIGMPLPLTPLQILWVNLVTDGLPALALGLEPPEFDVMRRPPRNPHENILGLRMGVHILWVGLLMALLSLGVGYVYWNNARPAWQTMILMTLIMSQMANVMAIRSEKESLFKIGWMSNRPLLAAVGLTTLAQLAIIYVPTCQRIFHTQPLSALELGLSLLLGSMIFWGVEFEKWIQFRKTRGFS